MEIVDSTSTQTSLSTNGQRVGSHNQAAGEAGLELVLGTPGAGDTMPPAPASLSLISGPYRLSSRHLVIVEERTPSL